MFAYAIKWALAYIMRSFFSFWWPHVLSFFVFYEKSQDWKSELTKGKSNERWKNTHTHTHVLKKLLTPNALKWATKCVIRSPSLSSHKWGECCCRIESRYVWVTHFFMICCIRFLCFGQLSKWNVDFPLYEWWQTRHAIQISSILWWIMWAGAAAFDMDCRTWVKDYHRYMCELRAALRAHVPDNELRLLVEVGMAHYNDLFRLKAVAAKTDVFQLVSGTWVTPAERCFMWMGGFRPSEALKAHYGKK